MTEDGDRQGYDHPALVLAGRLQASIHRARMYLRFDDEWDGGTAPYKMEEGKMYVDNSLYLPDAVNLSRCLPKDLRAEVLSVVLEWRYVIQSAEENAFFAFNYDLSAEERQECVAQAMREGIDEALDSCGLRLRKASFDCMAWWRVNTPDTIPTPPINVPRPPRYKPPPCEKCGGETGVEGSPLRRRQIKCKNPDCLHTWSEQKPKGI